MIDIVDILFSPTEMEEYASYLAILITDHHTEFCNLYPKSVVIPKLHFFVHMTRLIIK